MLRSRPEGRGNRYRLHPLAAKYESVTDMQAAFAYAAFAYALDEMKSGKLPAERRAAPHAGVTF
ncbi:hypothetical protein [Streptomyces sp. NPDC005989]|uniref:hypothetical protein n=1 Tax=Streptomyces sp. NPDC005989 TaxID=3156727 RepID=UPI0033C1DD6F